MLSGFIAQIERDLSFPFHTPDMMANLIASLATLPLDDSLALAENGELLHTLGIEARLPDCKVWDSHLAKHLHEAHKSAMVAAEEDEQLDEIDDPERREKEARALQVQRKVLAVLREPHHFRETEESVLKICKVRLARDAA